MAIGDYHQIVGNSIKPRSSGNYGRTVIQLDHPASEGCILTRVYCHSSGSGSGKVKIFRDDGANFVLVGEAAISNVEGDNVHVVSLPVEKGDYIAYYFHYMQADGVPNQDYTGSSAYIDGDVTGERAKSGFSFKELSSDINAGYVEVSALAFADVAVSRRYGERLYLSGSIDNIAESDEICVYFKRPGDTGIRNLKSDTSDYLYFNGISGSYDLGANNRYIEFERSGYHWLKIWDVTGNCETPVLERASWLMDLKFPRFQYQVIFDLEDEDLGDNLWRLEAEYAKFEAAGWWEITYNLWRLEAEYAKFEAAGWWEITHEDPDCFSLIAGHGGGVDETPQSGWLSLGVEFGESPCAPLPYYLCPLPTPQTQYWRGECSCDLFKNTLQPLGIPCWHLIAAKAWYSGETPWSDYVQCP